MDKDHKDLKEEHPENLETRPKEYWHTWISFLLTILFSIIVLKVFYSIFFLNLPKSLFLGYSSLFLLFCLLLILLRNPEIANFNFFLLLIILLLGSGIFLSWKELKSLLKNHKNKIQELIKGRDLKIPNVIEYTENNVKRIQNYADQTEKIMDNSRDIVELHKLEVEARGGNRKAFEKMIELSNIATYSLQQEAQNFKESLVIHYASYFMSSLNPIPDWTEMGIASDAAKSFSLKEFEEKLWNNKFTRISFHNRGGLIVFLNSQMTSIGEEEKDSFNIKVFETETNVFPLILARRYLSNKFEVEINSFSQDFSGFLKAIVEARNKRKSIPASTSAIIPPIGVGSSTSPTK